MTKSDIVNILSEQHLLKKKDVSLIIDGFLQQVLENTKKDKKIEIRGFGSFFLHKKKARQIKSPFADKAVDIPAKTILGFKASKSTENITDDNRGA